LMARCWFSTEAALRATFGGDFRIAARQECGECARVRLIAVGISVV
jgi:hypothetical protein